MSFKEFLKNKYTEIQTLDKIPTFLVPKEGIVEVAKFVKENDFDFLMDLCGVDFPENEERFEVVYLFFSSKNYERIRLKVRTKDKVPSIVKIYKGADWFEREVYDMFGVQFEGHPDLRRILTGDYFKGHPLRKDYPAGKRWKVLEEDVYKPSIESDEEKELEEILINIGPSHPSTHGTFRLLAKLDGEVIRWMDAEIGYLHRCFEKMSETHIYQQVIPYTDRLNYCSSFLNNVGYCKAVEEMLSIEIPERAKLIRVILGELSRIMDHLVCLAANIVDIGALTNYWYLFQPREEIYGILEKCCGARLTVSYCRIGGLSKDVPEDFKEMVEYVLKITPPLLNDVDKLVSGNPIFLKRTMNVGKISPEDAIAYGWTGPCLRAAGVPYDVRKAYPYYFYDEFDWDIPVGSAGDTYDRYQVRMEEMRQSLKIVKQAIERLKPGPVVVDDPRILLPPKKEVYNTMEGLIYNFEKVMFGLKVPKGEYYGFTEGANGELGYYIVSDGTTKPYRVRVRPPCFAIYQAFPKMMVGQMVADSVAVLGSLNIIAGELDR